MLKKGNDHFEVSKLETKVNVCEKRYVFDAQSRGGSTRPLTSAPAASARLRSAGRDRRRREGKEHTTTSRSPSSTRAARRRFQPRPMPMAA